MRSVDSRRFAGILCGAVLFLAGALLLSACAPRRATNGHLVVIGGSLRESNTEIYNRIAELTGEGTIGVLPTASGVPDESGPAAAERLESYTGEGRATVIDITTENPEAANTRETAEEIASHDGIFFTGGDQARVTAAFRPDGRDTRGYRALEELLGRDGVIAGTSAGAAMMSDPMIMGGTSTAALLHGRAGEGEDAPGVLIGPGMGFFPYGITDQHSLARGRLGRLIVALDETATDFGFAVDDNRAFHADLNTGVLEALGGPQGFLFVDVTRTTRSAGGSYGVRLSLLGSGDRLLAENGEVIPAVEKIRLTPPEGEPGELAAEDAWGRHVIRDLIVELAFDPATEAVAQDENFELHFVEDDWTRYWVAPGGDPETLTVVDLRLDIIPKPGETVAQAAD